MRVTFFQRFAPACGGLMFAVGVMLSESQAQEPDAKSSAAPLASAYDLCLTQAQDQPERALIMTSDGALAMDDAELSHCRAEALLSLGRFEEAARLFENLAAAMDGRAPGDAGFLWQQAAFAWQEAGQSQQAVAVLDMLLLRFADQPELWIQKASLQVQGGDAEAGLATLSAALERFAQASAPSAVLGKLWVYRAGAERRLGRIDAAKASLIQALSQPDLDQPLYVLELALVEAAQDNLPAARSAFVQLIATFPDSPEAALAQRYLARIDQP